MALPASKIKASKCKREQEPSMRDNSKPSDSQAASKPSSRPGSKNTNRSKNTSKARAEQFFKTTNIFYSKTVHWSVSGVHDCSYNRHRQD